MPEKLNFTCYPYDGHILTSRDLKCDLTKKWFKCFRWRSGWAAQRRLPFFATYRGSRDLRGGAGTRPPVNAKVAQTPVNARVKAV